MNRLLITILILLSSLAQANDDVVSINILCTKNNITLFEISNAHMATYGLKERVTYNVDFLLGIHPILSGLLPVSIKKHLSGEHEIIARGAILKSAHGGMSDYEDTLKVYINKKESTVLYIMTSGYTSEVAEQGTFECSRLNVEM